MHAENTQQQLTFLCLITLFIIVFVSFILKGTFDVFLSNPTFHVKFTTYRLDICLSNNDEDIVVL